jgi:hypothetical protein
LLGFVVPQISDASCDRAGGVRDSPAREHTLDGARREPDPWRHPGPQSDSNRGHVHQPSPKSNPKSGPKSDPKSDPNPDSNAEADPAAASTNTFAFGNNRVDILTRQYRRDVPLFLWRHCHG